MLGKLVARTPPGASPVSDVKAIPAAWMPVVALARTPS
jgi:hypothetical protein